MIQPTTTYRVNSIDILRGLIMIIMALDHTRDFFHATAMTADPLNPATTTPALYFTRWITHFCAPTFVFLSGVSAYLASRKRSPKEASLFLIKRGLWLVIVEITIVTFGITFNPFFNNVILQVIWAIGWSMIVLGILSAISRKLVFAIGLLLFFGHNLLDYAGLSSEGTTGAVLGILLRTSGMFLPVGDSHIVAVFYAILPWTGAMLLGYSIGHWFTKETDPAIRRKYLTITGCSLVALFLVLRFINMYGNPFPWQPGEYLMGSVFNFLNTSKYPPSLQFFCMTLGPACLLLALFERMQTRWTNVVSVYGSVPFFYYILHFYLLHIVLAVLFFASGHSTQEINTPLSPFLFRPPTFGYNLPITYLIWLAVVCTLYFPCKWFSQYKKTHRQWWLSYL